MRRLVGIGAAAAALAGLSDGAAARPAPARLQITSQDFTLTASRHVVRAGTAIVELYNLGEDAHDLVIQRVGTNRPIARFEALDTNGLADKTLNLKPGRYVAYCSLPGHRALGMQTTFTVIRRAPFRRRR